MRINKKLGFALAAALTTGGAFADCNDVANVTTFTKFRELTGLAMQGDITQNPDAPAWDESRKDNGVKVSAPAPEIRNAWVYEFELSTTGRNDNLTDSQFCATAYRKGNPKERFTIKMPLRYQGPEYAPEIEVDDKKEGFVWGGWLGAGNLTQECASGSNNPIVSGSTSRIVARTKGQALVVELTADGRQLQSVEMVPTGPDVKDPRGISPFVPTHGTYGFSHNNRSGTNPTGIPSIFSSAVPQP